jgi:hypothetical protein
MDDIKIRILQSCVYFDTIEFLWGKVIVCVFIAPFTIIEGLQNSIVAMI